MTFQIGMMDGTEKEADANSPYEVGETMNVHGPDLQSLFVTDRRSSRQDQTVCQFL